MTDLTTDQVIDQCLSSWISSGVDATSADEMTAELRSHLQEATAAGKPLDTVIGSDIDAFAQEWASAFQGPQASTAPPEPTEPSLPRTDSRGGTIGLWFGGVLIVLNRRDRAIQ